MFISIIPSYINLFPLSISTLLAVHGYRKGSLSISGSMTAFFVGYLHLSGELKVFGVGLIVFYLIGSRATKVKASVKATLEEGHDPDKPNGNRNAIQVSTVVLSNSLASLIAAVLFKFACSSESNDLIRNWFGVSVWDTYPSTRPCALHGISVISESKIHHMLIYAALGHFSTCLADTLASELGILSTKPPILITTFKTCQPGTNGGVSSLGLVMSVLGGMMMGIVFVVDLLLENGGACGVEGKAWIWKMIGWASLAGLIGSSLDSILGATLQQTLFDPSTRRILTSRQAISTTSPTRKGKEKERQPVEIVCGRKVLDNNQVNLVASCLVAAGMAWIGSL